MKCQNCKEAIKEGNLFCTNCGHKQLPTLPKGYLVGYFILLVLYGIFSIVVMSAVFANEAVVVSYRSQGNGGMIGAPINSNVFDLFVLASFPLCFIIVAFTAIVRTKITMLYTGIAGIINMFISIFYLAVVAYDILIPNANSPNYCTIRVLYVQFGILFGVLIVLQLLIYCFIALFKNKQIIPIVTIILCSGILIICGILQYPEFIESERFCIDLGYYLGESILTHILFAVASISGIFMGDIMRRKLSTIYYIG